MGEEGEQMPFLWMEYTDDPPYSPVRRKRKSRPKKIEFEGWGSQQLIQFLKSLHKDVTEQISRYDVTQTINEYVMEHNLVDPKKKKRILCDGQLISLFGKKIVNRVKIYDLLEAHYAENQDDSEDEFSDEYGEEKSETKTPLKKKVKETPKSCYAAIIPDNIKLIYLKRSLVEHLSKDPENFEAKAVGSFVRIKSDPNDYLQKNPHHLVQVTGVKKDTNHGDSSSAVLLQVTNAIEDIHISKLSDNNFSEEECEDLRQKVKDGLLKRLTVGEVEQKAWLLHEDITRHWLDRELKLLQSLIDRCNEKGWRKEMFEHLERRDLLKNPSKQEELFCEVPDVIAEEIDIEVIPQESLNNAAEVLPGSVTQVNTSSSSFMLRGTSELSKQAEVLQTPSTQEEVHEPHSKQPEPTPEASEVIPEEIEREAILRESLHNAAEVLPATVKQVNNTSPILMLGGALVLSKQAELFWTPSKQAEVSNESPEIIAEEKETEVIIQKSMNNEAEVPLASVTLVDNSSTQSMLCCAPESSASNTSLNGTLSPQTSARADYPENHLYVHNQEQQKPPIIAIDEDNCDVHLTSVKEGSAVMNKPVVIELSDDDEDEASCAGQCVNDWDLKSSIWHYSDPFGVEQGPFSIKALKIWNKLDFFPSDFKVWKKGQSQEEAVPLTVLLRQMFPDSDGD